VNLENISIWFRQNAAADGRSELKGNATSSNVTSDTATTTTTTTTAGLLKPSKLANSLLRSATAFKSSKKDEEPVAVEETSDDYMYTRLQTDYDKELDRQWQKNGPVLGSVRIFEHHHILMTFNLRAIRSAKGKRSVSFMNGQSQYICYKATEMTVVNSTILTPVVGVGTGTPAKLHVIDPQRDSYKVECPVDTQYLGAAIAIGNEAPYIYDLRRFLECDAIFGYLLPKPSPPPPQFTASSNANDTSISSYASKPKINLVACTQLDAGHLEMMPQWIEYYKLIGFDQLWIYLDADIHTQIPDRVRTYMNRPDVMTYASLVPFHRKHHSHSRHVSGPFYWQSIQQLDCLTVAKRANVNWIYLNDVDE